MLRCAIEIALEEKQGGDAEREVGDVGVRFVRRDRAERCQEPCLGSIVLAEKSLGHGQPSGNARCGMRRALSFVERDRLAEQSRRALEVGHVDRKHARPLDQLGALVGGVGQLGGLLEVAARLARRAQRLRTVAGAREGVARAQPDLLRVIGVG